MGLKFCGGCRAGYDRVGLVRSMGERLAGKMEWMAAGSDDAAEIIVLCGCKTACVKPDWATDRPVHYITSSDDAQEWIAEINGRFSPRSGR